MSWIDPKKDPKNRQSSLKRAGKWLTKARIGLIIGPLVFLIISLLPMPQSMTDAIPDGPGDILDRATLGFANKAPLIALGTLFWVLIWWVTECMPLGVAALVPALVFSMTEILPWSDALMSFTNPIIWIFMAGFVLAAAFRKWELDRRIAIRLGSVYKGCNPMIAALFVAALPVFILTLTGSITASASVVFPFLVAYLSMAGVKAGGKYSEACMLVLAQAATAGAMLLLISTPPNLIAKETVEEFSQLAGDPMDLTFLDWLIIGTPHAIIGLFVTWIVVFKLLKPDEAICTDAGKMRVVQKQVGKMSRGELVVLGLLALAITLWLLPSVIKVIADYNSGLVPLSDALATVVPEAMPAVLVILLAGALKVRGEPVLKWDEIAKGIDWNVVFLFGGGIALGLGLWESGFAQWLAAEVSAFLGSNPSEWAIYTVSVLLGFLLTYAASNTAAALISCPIAASLALGAGPDVSVAPPIIGAALACSISSAIPSTTPPMAIVYSSGYVKIWTMFKVGIVSDLIRVAALILIGYPLLNALY